MYKSYASKYTRVHIDTVIQSSGSYEGGLSGEVPLGRRRIHGHPPAQFGALVYNIYTVMYAQGFIKTPIFTHV